MKRKIVLRSMISTGTYKEFINEILTLSKNNTPSYVCFANVHMVVEAYRNPHFQQVVNHATIVAPDGKPISIFLNLFNKGKQQRVCGMDLFPDLLKYAEKSNQSVYLLGSTNQMLSRIVRKAKSEFPLLEISGFYSPPFRFVSEEENNDIISRIKATSPNLIFVSLGCPKQEKWMALNYDKLDACLLGIGQAFNTYAGAEKRLPTWMRNLSLEWMYRLYLEPQRLWKRYILTNSYFIWLTFYYLISSIVFKVKRLFVKVKATENQLQKAEDLN